MDGCIRKLDNVVSGVPQGSVLGLLLFLLCIDELFSFVENKLYGYAGDSTLVAVVTSPGEGVAVAESLNRGLHRVSISHDLWGMKFNATKAKTMIVSRWCIIQPQSISLTLYGTVLKESADLVILVVTFDAKLTFEKHLCSVSRAAALRLSIMRSPGKVFHDWLLFL